MTSRKRLAGITMAVTVAALAACARADGAPQDDAPAGNPIFRDLYTADPAALVHDGRLYVFTGRDEAAPTRADFVMRDWHAFSTAAPAPDPDAWEQHGALLSLDDFAWADANAWASEVVRGPDGRFYWFVSTRWADAPPEGDRMSIGVAVAEHPLGPYEDAIGGPLITARLDNASDHNIDPTVLLADDGVYLYWGSFWSPRYVRLGESMTERVGEVRTPEGLDGFWEAPWLFERDGLFYMLYASNRNLDGDDCVTSRYYACIRYATADHPGGPWQHRGIVLGQVSSTTNHPAAIEFPRGSGDWWMVYHTADLPGGGNFRRSVAIDTLVFESDGHMRRVTQTRYDPPEPEPVASDDAALSAAITCSYTAPWERCEALQSGAEPDSSNIPGPNLGTRWATWPETGQQWVEYGWDEPVRVHASEIFWFQDTPDGEDGGVKRPASWSVQYWDGRAWAPVPGADGFGTALHRYNHTSFDPITTTRLRAVMETREDAGGVGALRWRVYAPAPAAVEAIEVSTTPGTPPELPERVELDYGDGEVLRARVRWRDYDPSLLERPGMFTVSGVVETTTMEAVATVTVPPATPTGNAAAGPGQEDWIRLFNGRDLDGWTVKIAGHDVGVNFGETFRVADGEIRVRYDQYGDFADQFGHLYYQRPFSHYRLRLEYRFVGDPHPGAPDYALRNSGVMLHSQDPHTMPRDQDWPIAVELQLLGGLGDGEPRPTGNVCTPGTEIVYRGEMFPAHCLESGSATYDGDRWVRAEALVLGDSLIQHIIEGDTVLAYRRPRIGGSVVTGYDPAMKQDGRALTEGFIALQSEGQPVDFRRVELLDLKGCSDPRASNYRDYYVASDPADCRYED